MYPIGGTSTASPSTQISFRGTKKGPLKDITVIGAKSGVHRGRFAYHSDGQGVSFLPNHPFRDGELVTVRTSAPLVRAKSGAVTFRILTRPSAKDLARIEKQFHSDPEGNPAGVENFRTRSDLKPPGLTIERNDAGASSDSIFLAVKGGPGQDGPTIRDAQGHLIWFRRVKPPFSPYDFRTQVYDGKPVLTWWQGKVLAGKGSGYGVMLDSQYRLVTHVSAGNGFKMDQHEFEITPQGTAFINVYEPVVWDLTKVGGPRNGIAWDSIVQEIDIKTGLVRFEWHSLAHVSVSLGTFPYRSGLPYDPFHVNSVSVEGDGSLILSARNTNALFRIDRRAGRIIWRLGGKRSDFTLGPGTGLIGQHQAVRQPDGTITVFDNGGSTRFPNLPDRPSRGVTLNVDEGARTVSLAHEYHHVPQELFSRSQGSMQRLPSTDVFLGWGGGNPYMTEFAPGGGDPLFEAHINPPKDDTYRAYRLPWSGARPTAPPDVVATSGVSDTKVFVSWNGATEVAKWEVLGGDAPNNLQHVTTQPKTNFETQITLAGSKPQWVQVKALDSGDNVIGTSAAIQPTQG
jgi:hypothetical protein